MADTPQPEPAPRPQLLLPPPARDLTDLYKVGGYAKVRQPDGDGDEIVVDVWLAKIKPVDLDKARAVAGGARATALSIMHLPESEEYMATLGMLVDLLGEGVMDEDYPDDDDKLKRGLAEQCIDEQMNDVHEKVNAQMTLDVENDDNEWTKDGYFDGLRYAWYGTDEAPGLDQVWQAWPEPAENEPPEAENARRVMAEMERFLTEFQERVAKEKTEVIDNLMSMSLEALRERAVKAFISRQGAVQWKRAFDRWFLFFTVRDATNHRKPYFDGVDHPVPWDYTGRYVCDLEEPTIAALLAEYKRIEVSDQEGKGLRQAASSSLLSEPPAEVGPSASSGPAESSQ